jgi:hypothetical protein
MGDHLEDPMLNRRYQAVDAPPRVVDTNQYIPCVAMPVHRPNGDHCVVAVCPSMLLANAVAVAMNKTWASTTLGNSR